MENGIKVFQKISQELTVLANPNADQHWIDKARDNLEWIQDEILPSGSGFDSGCKILEHSKRNRIIIQCDFHHMNENGYYDGWTYHTCIITPDLAYDHEMRVTGKNKRDIKNYILDIIYDAIDSTILNKTHYR
jgi:hypothetical protein